MFTEKSISIYTHYASNSSFIIIFIITTKSVVNVIVPAVISRNIGMMCDKFIDIRLGQEIHLSLIHI